MINKLEKILVDKKTENIDVFLQFGRKINEIIDSVNSLESAKETIAGLMDRVSKFDCDKFKEKKGGLENDLLNAAEDNCIGKQMEIVRQISHHRRIEEFYKQIAELKEVNKILWEENRKLKGVHPV